MNRLKKITTGMLILALILIVSGCTIAKDKGFVSTKDKLVGVMIVKEKIDVEGLGEEQLDMNSTMIYPLAEKRDIIEGKAIREKTDYGEEITGFDFGNIKGAYSMVISNKDKDGKVITQASIDNSMPHVNTGVGGKNSLIGDVYVEPDNHEGVAFYKVYQKPNGDVYLAAEKHNLYSLNYKEEGDAFGLTLDEEQVLKSKEKNDEGGIYSLISIKIKYKVEKIIISEINKEKTVIGEKEYDPKNIPEKMKLNSKAEYIVIESISKTPSGEKIERTIKSKSEGDAEILLSTKSGFFDAHIIELKW